MSITKNSQSSAYLYKPLGRYLIEADLITEDCVFQALEEQKKTKQRIGNILVNRGYINKNTLNYFVEKIVEPERFKNSERELAHEVTQDASQSSQIVSDRLSKTLNLPTLKISPRKITRLLLIVVFCLIFASCLAHFGAFLLNQSSSAGYSGRLFRLDEEINIPTLYSSLSLAFCSILLGIISYMKKIMNANDINYWKVLSFIFLFLAVDEMCSIHEMLSAIRPLINARGLFYFAWVIPGAIFVFVFLLVFWRFIQSLPRKTRNLFLIAGTIYVSGAIGVEMIGGYHSDVYGEESPLYALITTIEESMEMLGIVVFIYALLSYIKSHLKTINFRVSLQK